jgi:molybdopterin-guanine dinucleotide biosynthesis protein A
VTAPLVAVLAGGASRRMGAPKSLAVLDGRPLLERPLAAAAGAGLDAVVVAKPDTPLPALGVEVWLEPAEPRHPLTGLVAALARSGRDVIAVACDQPWVSAALLERLAAADPAARAVALRVAGELEPLPARYGPGALDALREALAAEAPLRRALAALDPHEVPADGLGDPRRLVASVNTPEALAEAERALG